MLLALLLLAAPCTAPAPLPPELHDWPRAVAVRASTLPVPFPIGLGARAQLRHTAAVRLFVRSDHATPATYAGVFSFNAAQAGRYRVALGAGAWVDVVAGTQALPSVAHAHGAECSPVRKMVDFDLEPGRYLLQIVGNERPDLPMMVVRLP